MHAYVYVSLSSHVLVLAISAITVYQQNRLNCALPRVSVRDHSYFAHLAHVRFC